MSELNFSDIEEHGFFTHNGVKLCKFGKYGMGVDSQGAVARKFVGNEPVEKCSL